MEKLCLEVRFRGGIVHMLWEKVPGQEERIETLNGTGNLWMTTDSEEGKPKVRDLTKYEGREIRWARLMENALRWWHKQV